MNLSETMAFIHCTDWKGSCLGLDRMKDLLHRLGDPHERLKYVHVAGTNGKGSTCAMLAEILEQAGYKTGLYTSPHLVLVNERMKINGIEITDSDLIGLAEKLQPAVAQMSDQPTEFEILTAMALLYFCEQGCDIVVLEVGLGGRLDATNVISVPEVAVLCNIGLEHTEILGDTLAKIAAEKAGIVKPFGKVVAYQENAEVNSVFADACKKQNAMLDVLDFEDLNVKEAGLWGQKFDWKTHTDMMLKLIGGYQSRNAAVAMETVEQLRSLGWSISDNAVRQGLMQVKWPARMEVLSSDPLFILDGAHNPQCVEALTGCLSQLVGEQKIIILTGVLADKDYDEMMAMVAPFASEFICLTPQSDRALKADDLAAFLMQHGSRATACPSMEAGIGLALQKAQGKPVVAFGSLYMAGFLRKSFHAAFRKWLRKNKIAAREALPVEIRTAYSRKIVQSILQSEAFQKAEYIMSYQAVRGEVNLEALYEEAEKSGKKIIYPLCTSNTEMVALYPKSKDAWVKGHYGIPEPVLEKSEWIDPSKIDLVLCPCSAFDEKCNRMGMGAGYYDRYLKKCGNAIITAAAFEAQKVAEIPIDVWDQPMKAVFTETQVYSA